VRHCTEFAGFPNPARRASRVARDVPLSVLHRDYRPAPGTFHGSRRTPAENERYAPIRFVFSTKTLASECMHQSGEHFSGLDEDSRSPDEPLHRTNNLYSSVLELIFGVNQVNSLCQDPPAAGAWHAGNFAVCSGPRHIEGHLLTAPYAMSQYSTLIVWVRREGSKKSTGSQGPILK
jgi:hypothetical protein